MTRHLRVYHRSHKNLGTLRNPIDTKDDLDILTTCPLMGLQGLKLRRASLEVSGGLSDLSSSRPSKSSTLNIFLVDHMDEFYV